MQRWSEHAVRSRWFTIGPDSVLYEVELRVGDTPHTGETEGRYALWPYNAEKRQGVRIEKCFGKEALLASPALQEWVKEGILAHLAPGLTAVLVWVCDAEAGERRVLQNTMPAWWREPCNTLALCQAWEVQDHANPLPLGWEEFESNGPFEQVAAKLAAE